MHCVGGAVRAVCVGVRIEFQLWKSILSIHTSCTRVVPVGKLSATFVNVLEILCDRVKAGLPDLERCDEQGLTSTHRYSLTIARILLSSFIHYLWFLKVYRTRHHKSILYTSNIS